MLFPKYQELIERSDFTLTAGTTWPETTLRIPITREKHLESIFVRVNLSTAGSGFAAGIFTPNTSTTALQEGLSGILKRVTFTANNRNYINAVRGSSLLRLAANIDGLDPATEAAVNLAAASTAGTCFSITYPIWLAHPQVAEPVRDALLVPMPLFNEDGVLELTIAGSADLGTVSGSSATFQVSLQVLVNRWHAPVSLPHAVHELNEYEALYTASGKYRYELPALGSYTGLLLSMFNTYIAETDLVNNYGAGAIPGTAYAAQTTTPTAGAVTLDLASTTIRKTKLGLLSLENALSKSSLRGSYTAAGVLTMPFSKGTGYFDFLNDGFGPAGSLNSVIDANPSATGGSRFGVNYDLTITTSGTVRHLIHRIFGDLSGLKLTGK